MHVPWRCVTRSWKRKKSFPETIKTLGDEIYVKRFEKGLTREQLAARAGILASTLAGWENGTGTPSDFERTRLASVLGSIQLAALDSPIIH